MATDDRVEDLLSGYLAARTAGNAPLLEDLCQDRPELLPELRRRVAVAEAMDKLATRADTDVRRDTAALVTPDSKPGRFPERLGEYAVVCVLGEGGMGAVLLAEDPALKRQVAIKVMQPGLAADPVARERFLREARSAAAVHHDNVVPIFHVGEDAGTPYLVMPFLAGESLDVRLTRDGALPASEACRIGHETAMGLAAAHARGLIHRDVKPGNLWLEAPNARVKVLDFGLARAANGTDGMTRSGAILGTPGYMAPEQADGAEVDDRADLFALGAVLYRCVTGTPAFAGKSLTAVLRAVAEHNPPPPHEVNPTVPVALSNLIMRLLAKNPADRPSSAEVVAKELASLRQTVEDSTSKAASPVVASRRRWGTRVAVALVLLVALALGVRLVTRPGEQPEQAANIPVDPAPTPALPPNGCDLRLMFAVKDVSGIPTGGKNLIVVASVGDILHFRIFDHKGKTVVDTDETKLPAKAGPITDLKKQLESLQPPHKLTEAEKNQVITVGTSIVGHTPPNGQPAITPVTGVQPTRYRGSVDVLIERTDGGVQRLRRLNRPGALPLRQKDKFVIEGKVDPPTYLYVVWVDPDHDVTPVYPWDPEKGWGSRPAKEERLGLVRLPPTPGDTYRAPEAKPGMATIVLFACPTPLEVPDAEIQKWFETLPELPLPAGGDGSAVWFDNYVESADSDRSRTFERVAGADPFARWQGQLQKSLGGKDSIQFQTSVSFARTGRK